MSDVTTEIKVFFSSLASKMDSIENFFVAPIKFLGEFFSFISF